MDILATAMAVGILLLAVIMLGLVLAVHEAGHLVAAKLVGIGIEEFEVGVGPVLVSRAFRGTRYTFRLFPLYGYVKAHPPGHNDRPVWARTIFILGGPMANFITVSLLAMWALPMMAAAQGYEMSLGTAVVKGVMLVPKFMAFVVSSIGAGGLQVEGMGSAISMGGQAVLQGGVHVLVWLIGMSLSIGLFNLLPLPPLDGGRLLLCGLEALRRRPLSPRLEARIVSFGWAALMALFVALSIKDALSS